MEIINLKETKKGLEEYAKLCIKEWGTYSNEEELKQKVQDKVAKLSSNTTNTISALGLMKKDTLVGFISLFKTDGEERQDVTPWYATMYVKKEFRGNHYSKVLNDAILKEARKLGYKKIYLKSNLIHYYEKFGAKYMEDLKNGEKLYFIDL